jgi:putative glutathione S-transferase
MRNRISLLGATLLVGSWCQAFLVHPNHRSRQTRLLAEKLNKGFNLLELAGGLVPQGVIVQTVSESWKLAWKTMMVELAPQDDKGNYQRPSYSFSSAPPLDLEQGTYHLYVGNPCPWCQRTLLALLYLQLDDRISVTRLQDNPKQASRGGWIFSATQPDRLFGGCRDLRELYETLSPGFQGRCTAPLLVNVRSQTIVSNESSEIVQLLNDAAQKKHGVDSPKNLYPEEKRREVDEINDWVYNLINNGVYRCGFATTQSAYNQASSDVREGLDRCNRILSSNRYLCGDQFTVADLRLLPTIVRFDGAYAPLFRAAGGHTRIRDYPHLHVWLQRCWKEHPAVSQSIDLADACASYFAQLFPLNPSGIVPSPPVTAKLLGLEDE